MHYDITKDLLFFLYSNGNSMGCEQMQMNEKIEEDPFDLSLLRKTVFLEFSAEFIEFDSSNMTFFLKFENFFRIYEITGQFHTISFNPLDYCKMRHSSKLILIFNEITITKYPIIPFKVYNYKGEYLNSFDIVLKKNLGIELLDVFETHLFLKQFHDELIVINLLDGDIKETKGFVTPKNIEYFRNQQQNKCFLICFYAFGVQFWDFQCRKIKEFRFSVANESLFFIERTIGILITGFSKVSTREKDLWMLDLNNFENYKEVSLGRNEEILQLFCSETANVYILYQNDINRISII